MPTPRPFRQLLIATDFSANADWALDRAALLPLDPNVRVIILHVLPTKLDPEQRARIKERAWAELERRVKRFTTSPGVPRPPGAMIRPAIGRGRPDEIVAKWARLLRSELIVVGRHGARRWRAGLLGSTADRLIRAGSAPVLVVAPGQPRAYRRPLAAIAQDAASLRSAALMLRVLPADCRRPTAFHSVDLPFEGWIKMQLSESEMKELRRERATAVGRLLEDIEPASGRWRIVSRHGDPRDTILREARRARADLIAVGTKGRSGMARLFLGSVAEGVIHHATCDVLAVRPGRE